MDETAVQLRDAEASFETLTPLIRAGRVITLYDQDKAVAEIRPIRQRALKRRPFGLARGTFTVPSDFGGPNREVERLFYGE